MRRVNVHKAKTRVSRLLEAAEVADEVIGARADRPVAPLPASLQPPPERVFGQDSRLFVVPDDFDEPLPVGLFTGEGSVAPADTNVLRYDVAHLRA